MKMRINSIVDMAQAILAERVGSAARLVDATAGNGKDTLFLAQNSPPHATVWSLDIQPEALCKSRRLAEENGVANKVRFILDSHANLASYLDWADVVMFNLGYCPGGDRTVFTKPDSTVAAIKAAAELLTPQGLLSIVAYPGTEAGFCEHAAVQDLVSHLPRPDFFVWCWQAVNAVNTTNPAVSSPILYIVFRTGRSKDKGDKETKQ